MALHLGPQDQFGLQFGDARLNFQVVVADQRVDTIELGRIAHITGKLAAVSADADDSKAHFLSGHFGSGDRMRGVAKYKDPLAGQVGGVDRSRIPGGTRIGFGQKGVCIQPGQLGHFSHEGTGGAAANWNHFGKRLPKIALQPLRAQVGNLWVKHHVEIRIGQSSQIGGCGRQRGDDVDLEPHVSQQLADLGQIVTVPEAQRRWPQDVAALFFGLGVFPSALGRLGKMAHQLIEGF